jgi:hypothetical protein
MDTQESSESGPLCLVCQEHLFSKQDPESFVVMTLDEFHKKNSAAIRNSDSPEDYSLGRTLTPEEERAYAEGRLKVTYSGGSGYEPDVEIVPG